MKHRIQPYAICVLVALLFGIIPAAIAFDLATPIDRWDYWYWGGQPSPMPHFNLSDNLPPLLRRELLLFKWLVIPPGLARKAFGSWPDNYALPYVSPGSSTEAWAALPPAALALEHLRTALPFWLAGNILLYEVARIIRRMLSRRSAAA
jgi:hypothetical protein